MRKRIAFVGVFIFLLFVVVVTIIVANNNNDTRTELMTYSLNQKSFISFGKYDGIVLKSENKTGTYEKKYVCETEETFNTLKEELTQKAYHVSSSDNNYLVFYQDSFFYGMLFRKIKYNGDLEERNEICLYPFCSRIGGLYPFFLGGTSGTFSITSGFEYKDGFWSMELDYDVLKTLTKGDTQFNSLDIYTKEEILDFFTKISPIYCKIENDIIYLRSSSNVYYNIDYSLSVELYDDSLKISKLS